MATCAVCDVFPKMESMERVRDGFPEKNFVKNKIALFERLMSHEVKNGNAETQHHAQSSNRSDINSCSVTHQPLFHSSVEKLEDNNIQKNCWSPGYEKAEPSKLNISKANTTNSVRNSAIHVNTTDNSSMTFKKRKGATNFGILYENLMIALITTKLSESATHEGLKLSSNYGKFKPFDDIVVENGNRVCAFQLKYKENFTKKFTINHLLAPDGDLSVIKYINEIAKILKTSDTFFKTVLLTNKSHGLTENSEVTLKMGDSKCEIKVKIVKDNSDLMKLLDIGSCYTFEVAEGQSILPNYAKATEMFTVCFQGKHIEKLEEELHYMFFKHFDSEQNIADNYLKFITHWNNLPKKDKLLLPFIRKIIVLCVLEPFMKSLHFDHQETNTKTKLFREVLVGFQFALFDVNSLYKIQFIWRDIVRTVNHIELLRTCRTCNLVPNRVNKVEHLTNDQLSKALFLNGTCPLVVDNMASGIIRLLSKNDHIIFLNDVKCIPNFSKFNTFRTLDDLRKCASYKTIVDTFQCSMQGKQPITLGDLIGPNDNLLAFITTDQLVSMLEYPLLIGEIEQDITPLYIPRYVWATIVDDIFLSLRDDNTLIIISNFRELDNNFKIPPAQKVFKLGDNSNDFDLLSNINQGTSIITTDQDFSEHRFEHISSLCPNKKHHQFRVFHGDKLEWVRSSGDIRDLKNYLKEDDRVSERQLQTYENDNSINILKADAGMGKTTLLKKIRNETPSNVMSIFVKAKDFEGEIRGETLFEDILQKVLIEDKRAIFFWDGLDEVSNEILEKILEMVDRIAAQGCKQWIACRHFLADKLENKFHVIAKKICYLSENEQSDYVKVRLKNLEVDPSKVFDIIETNKNFFPEDILGTALYITMLTDFFVHNEKMSSFELKQSISFADLCKYYIDEKFQIANEAASRYDCRIFNDYKRYRYADYEKAAMQTHFDRKLDVNCDEFLEQLKQDGGDFIGIITNVTPENMPNFCNNLFSEYFAGLFLSKNLEKLSQMRHIIFEERFNQIRFFVDAILAERSPAHIAVLHKNIALLKNCTNEQLLQKDKAGRNVLHFACSWSQRYPLLPVVKTNKIYVIDPTGHEITPESPICSEILTYLINRNLDPEEEDDLFKLNSFSYAFKSGCLVSVLKLMCHYDVKPQEFQDNIYTMLYYAARFDFSKIFHQDTIPKIEIKDFGSLPLLAVHHNSVNTAKILMSPNYCKILAARKEPLMKRAYEKGYNRIVNILVKKKFQIDQIVHRASNDGNIDVMKMLLPNKNLLELRDSHGKTPLHYACQRGHYDIVKLLIDSGVSLTIMDYNNKTPYDYVVDNKFKDIQELIESFS